jgi:hypothetical protein
MAPSRATAADRAYFEKIAQQNRALEEDDIPASLAEMFDRLERMRRSHGDLATPGVAGPGDGDLPSHLAFLERSKEIGRGGENGA